MTKEQIEGIFESYLKDNILILNPYVSVDFNIFYERFKEVEEPKYDLFRSHDHTGAYSDFFDRCKSDGLLH